MSWKEWPSHFFKALCSNLTQPILSPSRVWTKQSAQGEFGWHTTSSSITVWHRACHRWDCWWTRRGTGSLSTDCCYSNLLNLLRVMPRVCSYNLYTTPFFSYPSQFTLVKLIKLKRTQSVCTEKERKRKATRGKTERKHSFFHFFLQKKN